MSDHKDRRDPVAKLVFELSKLPGIGEKTATRLTYFILKQDPSYAQALSSAVIQAREQTRLCEKCMTLTDVSPCATCRDTSRDQSILCVVEKPADVNAIEQTVGYRGSYHVLHGLLSPLDGVGPEEIKIRELLQQVQNLGEVREIILAMNPSVEGEATSLYLFKLLKPLGIKVSRLAHGIPVGGMLEYTDRQTIVKAIENRVEI
jgi:recombination protein RecR